MCAAVSLQKAKIIGHPWRNCGLLKTLQYHIHNMHCCEILKMGLYTLNKTTDPVSLVLNTVEGVEGTTSTLLNICIYWVLYGYRTPEEK